MLLVEQHDLAAHTSSASTKLIHGGLRYLEYYEFRLVREALRERERLLNIAPHIIWPLDFVLPHAPRPAPGLDGARRAVFLRPSGPAQIPAGLARRALWPASRRGILQPDFRRGFTYADCWVEDSRLVVLNAMDAAERGADIRTRTRLISARPEGALWHAHIEEAPGRAKRSGRARWSMPPVPGSATSSAPHSGVTSRKPCVGERQPHHRAPAL